MENKGNNNNNGNNNGRNNGGNNRNGMTVMIFILAALVVLFLTSLLNSCAKDATNKEVTYSEFINMIESDKVEEVTFTSNRIKIKPKSNNSLYRISYYTAELNDETLLPLLKEHGVKFSGTVEDVSSMILWNMVSYILPLVLVWVLLYFLIFRKMGGGGVMGVGKTTAKVYVEKSTGVTFKDVAGQDEAKDSLQEVVDFLHNPKKYTDIGAKLPKGALLVGPPGTGKTLLAKAVAGEAKVPFFSLAGSDFVEMFVGVGASRVRDLFKEAQKQAPCIIFIDEIDAIGKSRDTRYGGNDEREQTLNQLLAEMDGFDTSKGLLILAATNRPEVLDKALLRPGRFDRRIIVDKPDLKGRVETLKVHVKNVLMDDTVDLDAIALATSGAVGSDLANMINEAAINAVKAGRKYVNQEDLFESVEVVIAGKEKKDRIMGPKEKKMVAYHEVGHALVTALQKDTEPVQKITIVPRTMGALGYTMQVPEEEKFLMTKNELAARLVTYMGGRAAEEIVFDSVTTGASNDIEQATKIARAMVTQYGMSEKFGLMGLVTIENQYLDGRASLNCGEDTAAQIDQEVMRILKESYDEAVCLLQENRSILDEISQYLYENETITGKEFMRIFRELKGIPEQAETREAETEKEKFGYAKKEWVQEKEAQDVPGYPDLKENTNLHKEPDEPVRKTNTPEESERHLEANTLGESGEPLEVNTLGESGEPLEVNTLGESGEPLEVNTMEEPGKLPLEVNTLKESGVPEFEVNTMVSSKELSLEVNTMEESGEPLEVDTLAALQEFSVGADTLEESAELPLEVNTLEESKEPFLEVAALEKLKESSDLNDMEESGVLLLEADPVEEVSDLQLQIAVVEESGELPLGAAHLEDAQGTGMDEIILEAESGLPVETNVFENAEEESKVTEQEEEPEEENVQETDADRMLRIMLEEEARRKAREAEEREAALKEAREAEEREAALKEAGKIKLEEYKNQETDADRLLRMMLKEAKEEKRDKGRSQELNGDRMLRTRMEEGQEMVFLEAEEVTEHVRQVIPEELTRKVFNRDSKTVFQKSLKEAASEHATELLIESGSEEDGEDYLDKLLKGMN